MKTSPPTVEIQTLGRLLISVQGTPVATQWPDETLKVLFCSLLSPLDLYFTWDRICRSMLGVPAARSSMRQLDEVCIRPLKSFLIKEMGFNPLITSHEGIRINQKRIQVDALEFYRTVLDGLRLQFFANNSEAREKFSKAKTLYSGSYLPGMSGKIIANTRSDLESLYQSAIIHGQSTFRHKSARLSR